MRQLGETKWMNIVLDTDTMEITITQRWKYVFESLTGYAWTEKAKRIISAGIIDLIYRYWNHKAYAIINTDKGTRFAQAFGKKIFTIKFKIEDVTCGEHWTVQVVKNKVRPSKQPTGVEWDSRLIVINDFDLRVGQGHHPYISFGQITTKVKDQCTAAHEFGHAIGNIGNEQYTGDEYIRLIPEHISTLPDGSYFYPLEKVEYPDFALHGDVESIMNIGNEVRHRHFAYIRDMLQEMFPGNYFSIGLF